MAAAKWMVQEIPSQSGKVALITGASSGIGYQAALELARHGAQVLLGCRNAAKGQAALERLQRDVPGASAEVVALDMASLVAIRAFVMEFAARGIALDLLINNAGGTALPKRELTVDGFERQFGTNHLGHFALTGLLIPQLLAAPKPRVVTVSSLAHRDGTIDFDNLQSEKKYHPWGAYGSSKLANLLFANELNRRAMEAGSRLMSIPVHPGVANTNITKQRVGWQGLKPFVLGLLSPVVRQTDADGALPTLYAATSHEAKGGEYIGPAGRMETNGPPVVVQSMPKGKDVAVAQRLWGVSEELTGVVYPALG